MQILVCFGGVLSVFCSWRNAIRIHWLMMIPLVLMDLTVIGLNAARIQTLHRNMEQLIAEKSVSLGGLNTCPDWMGMRQEWMCCPPSVVVHACQRAGECSTILEISPSLTIISSVSFFYDDCYLPCSSLHPRAARRSCHVNALLAFRLSKNTSQWISANS